MIDITIAIPVYNVEKYVEKSLLSALNQDFSGSYEILVVDDKGTDKSMDVVRRVIENHKKGNIVRIVEHSENKGLGPARNTAIDEAKGKYLFFLDSDDWITENCLTVLYRKAIETNAQVTVGSLCRVNERTNEQTITQYKDIFVEHSSAGVFMLVQGIFMNIEVWNKLFDLNFLRTNNIRSEHRIMEDSIFDFNMRVLAKRIAMSSEITLFYNIRENSILTKIFEKKGTHESAYVYCDIIKRCQDLIKTKYKGVDGIFDLYYLRVEYSVLSLSRSQYSDDDILFIKKSFKDINRFVPSVQVIKKKKYRIVNKMLKVSDNYVYYKYLFLVFKYVGILKRLISRSVNVINNHL